MPAGYVYGDTENTYVEAILASRHDAFTTSLSSRRRYYRFIYALYIANTMMLIFRRMISRIIYRRLYRRRLMT